MDMTTLFVRNLKKWRKSMGFSQKVLAERCDAAHSYIRQIESGKGHPSFVFIEKLAKALNIEPFKLFIDDTVSGLDISIKANAMNVIKSEFLEKVEYEFENAVNKIST